MVEVHVTFSRDCFGPDVPASITISEMQQLVAGIRDIEKALQCPVDKEDQAAKLADSLRLFSKSIVAASGTVRRRSRSSTRLISAFT